MSEHFGPQRNTRRALCERFAPLLAALVRADTDTSTDTSEMAEARAHLASCPYCQADQRDYAALDGAVRSAFGQATVAPFRTADLLMAIGATSEPQPRRAGDPIRSVRYLKDFDDLEGHTTMSDTDERAPDGAKPATMLATRPGLRLPRGAALRRQALTLGFSATATAVILIVVAVSLFGSHWRPSVTHSRLAHTTATQTTSLPATASAGITAVSMDSPTDGWALGDATLNPYGTPTNVGIGFYHYDGHSWILTQRIAGLVVYGLTPSRIQAFSKTNAWAYVFDPKSNSSQLGGMILHYDGTSWKPTSITLRSGEQLVQLEGFEMTSPTEGWAAAYLTGGSAGPGALGFLHFDGQRWAVDKDVFAPSDMDLHNTGITGFSTLPGIVWAVGWSNNAQTAGYNQPMGLIFHRIGGVWSLFRQLGSPDKGQGASLMGVMALNANSVWAIGETSLTKSSPNGPEGIPTAQIWRYGAVAGSAPDWTPVSVGISGPGAAQYFGEIHANSDHDIWVAGLYSGSTVYRSGFESTSMLLHYDGSNWSQVKPTVDIGKVGMGYITTIDLAPNGDLWAAGYFRSLAKSPAPSEPLIWRYHDGAWSAVPIASK